MSLNKLQGLIDVLLRMCNIKRQSSVQSNAFLAKLCVTLDADVKMPIQSKAIANSFT